MHKTLLATSAQGFKIVFFTCLLLTGFLIPAFSNNHPMTVTCPNDLFVQAGPGQCGTFISFEDLEWSSTIPIIDTVFIPASGSYFETGATSVIMAVTDLNGTISTCIFNVVVQEPNGGAAMCEGNAQLSLENQCEREIEPDEVLSSNSGCLGNYEVFRVSQGGALVPGIITGEDVGMTFSVQVVNTLTGAQCMGQATVTGGTPPAITCPPNIFQHCNEPTDTSYTGVPALTGCYQNVELTYTDELVSPLCFDSIAFQINRTWISTDPFGKQDTCLQLIRGVRIDVNLTLFPPDFDGTEEPPLMCSDTSTWEELASPEVTGEPTIHGYSPEAHFDCKIAVSYEDFVENSCGASYEIARVWKVVKLCPPSITLTDTQFIWIADPVGPVFEIPDTIYVSLATECADSLYLPSAEILSECSGYSVEIVTPWDTLSTNGGLTHVELTAGTYPVTYTFTDECGNVSQQVSTMLINEEVLVSCPPDATVSCDYYFDTLFLALQLGDQAILEQIGNPVFASNCPVVTTESAVNDINACGEGQVTRTITTTNVTPTISCTQHIEVFHVSDFEVLFPADLSLCTGNLGNAGQPQIFNATCEVTSMTSEDAIIPSGLNGCFTVERTWTIKNNCIYTGDNLEDDVQLDARRYADGGDGIIEHVQIIHVNSSVAPVFPNGCEIADKTVPTDACSIFMAVPTPPVNGCGDTIMVTVSGNLGDTLGAQKELTPGTYSVNYVATDACGNQGTCSTQFEVVDLVEPVAVCTSHVVELMNTDPAIVQILAIDFDDGSSDNCGNLQFSFSSDPTDIGQIFHCCQEGQHPLEIWVTDASGNQSMCETFVIVQANMSGCDCDPMISGSVRTEENEGINNVFVNNFGGGNFNQNVTTDINGHYAVDAPTGGDYTITPFKNSAPVNGVSTFDLVVIRRHILGIELLDSPYKIIAADANKSNSVTTFDLVVLQQLILGVTTAFPNDNTSWRFVDSDYDFPNPADPFLPPWPETLQFNNVTSDVFGADFVGIKVGDVNGSADPQN